MTATRTDTLAAARDAVTEPMREALGRLDPPIRHICGYHLGLWDADGRPGAGGGKALRPALALLSARAAGAGPEVGVPAAVACELVHNFSLLHDDLMDGDRERRHRVTAWALFGESPAILAGDALLALANEVLAEAPSPTVGWAIRCLNATTRRLVAGQSADLAFESRDDVTVEECLRMADDKTGALLACAASLGAVLADAPSALALGLARFGTGVGLAFQLADDLLGIWGRPERTGKPVLSDLRSRKKSLPVVAALRSGTPAAAELGALYAAPDGLDEAGLQRAADLVVAAGGRSWTEERADRALSDALAVLDELAVPADVAAELASLARLMSRRDH
ncbi:MAG TPA: polyprenyl synthetase family protein [Nocardioidaceae bacterium]|nr:polyprenyl synthetase family protein [Nocardioidaceae bacterium]